MSIIAVAEACFQCARALMRDQEDWPDLSALPGPGRRMPEIKRAFDAQSYDREWPERAGSCMW